VASIEMFEAVGEEYWPTYFDKVAQVLRPGGKAALQIITIRGDLFARYRRRADFIQHFIFPGGMLPSDEELSRQTARAGLARTETAMFGQSYALTLKEWARRFNEAWPRIAPLGFDETFRRLWQFYLAYCEAGFRNGRIDVGQFVLART
jgi:cyclopropane-fatty-acyl-phospholipid synthase